METENDGLGPNKGETAEQFKGRIEEKQRELKREENARAAAAPKPAPAAAPQVTPPVSQDERPAKPQVAPAVATGNPEVDEWLGKKGFKSPEDVAVSLRELEREFHRDRQDARDKAPVAPVPPAQPPVAPVIPWGYPYPPAPPRPDPAAMAEEYNMAPEDFQRVAKLASDMAEAIVNRRLGTIVPGLHSRVQNVERESTLQRDLVSLMADPYFKHPQVAYEMHRVIQENPAIFEKQPLPYRYAFDEALKRVARANLGGSNQQIEKADKDKPTAKPPITAGGNGTGSGESTSTGVEIDTKAFAALSREEKKAYLKSVGAIS